MEKEKMTNARSGWRASVDRGIKMLKAVWKTANEFDLIEKAKEMKLADKAKTWLPTALVALNSLSLKANTEEHTNNDKAPLDTEMAAKLKTPADSSTEYKLETTEAATVMNASFKAYQGSYYNEKCNGSPCWLASTYETNGAGIGKNPSSIATWNDRGGYRGLNQISPDHARKFLAWLSTQKQYKQVYDALKAGGVGKANWQKVAKQLEHPMTDAFENYMVKKYNPDNMKYIQDELNKTGLKVSIHKLHPAILSCMHQIMVERPASRDRIANKIARFVETHGGDESKLNSGTFIKTLISNTKIQERAINLLNDSTISWKESQFKALLSRAVPAHDDKLSWFNIESAKKQKAAKETRRQQIADSALQKAQQDAARGYRNTLTQVPLTPKILEIETSPDIKLPEKGKPSKGKKVIRPKQESIIYNDRMRRKNSGRA